MYNDNASREKHTAEVFLTREIACISLLYRQCISEHHIPLAIILSASCKESSSQVT